MRPTNVKAFFPNQESPDVTFQKPKSGLPVLLGSSTPVALTETNDETAQAAPTFNDRIAKLESFVLDAQPLLEQMTSTLALLLENQQQQQQQPKELAEAVSEPPPAEYGSASGYDVEKYMSDLNNNLSFVQTVVPETCEKCARGDLDTISNLFTLIESDENCLRFFVVWYACDAAAKQNIRLSFLFYQPRCIAGVDSLLFNGITQEESQWLTQNCEECRQQIESRKPRGAAVGK
jgi:hypothetical protein